MVTSVEVATAVVITVTTTEADIPRTMIIFITTVMILTDLSLHSLPIHLKGTIKLHFWLRDMQVHTGIFNFTEEPI